MWAWFLLGGPKAQAMPLTLPTLPASGVELPLNERHPFASAQPSSGRPRRAAGAFLDLDTGAKPACSHLSAVHTPKARRSGKSCSKQAWAFRLLAGSGVGWPVV